MKRFISKGYKPESLKLPQARNTFHTWMLARLPRNDQLTLTQGNVYILPSRAGWAMLATLIVLLIAAINYQLNLGYLLTFCWLAALQPAWSWVTAICVACSSASLTAALRAAALPMHPAPCS